MKEAKTIYDKVSDEGDSPIYVGISYLKIVAQKMATITLAADEAYEKKGTFLFKFLNSLRTFYDLVESRIGIDSSTKEVESFRFELVDNKMTKITIKIKEGEKYEHLFNEIELMIERNSTIIVANSGNPYLEKKYINDKKILLELSRCHRELMRDANRNHLIMPEGIKDIKELVKSEWIDREKTKEF